MGAFETQCYTCGAEIKMVPTGDKKPDGRDRYLPRNLDGSQHRCTPGEPATDTKVYAGILKSALGNGVLIHTDEKGDRTYAISKTLLPPDLPVKITFRLLPKNYVEIVTIGEPVKKEPPVSDDRMDGPADGECIVEPLVKAPEPPAPAAPQKVNEVPKNDWSLNPPLGVKDRAIILQTALKVAGDMYAGMPEPDMNKAPQVVTEWAIYMARGIFMELMK